MPRKRIVVVGAAGYIGARLFERWPVFRDTHEFLRLDADIYDRGLPKGVQKVGEDPEEVERAVADFKPDIIVNVAALAHDPKGLLHPVAVYDTNWHLPRLLTPLAKERAIHISSMSVFDKNEPAPYIGSKRALESSHAGDIQLCHRARILRFGTIFGWDTDDFGVPLPSTRAHLLLNRMVIQAASEGVIHVNGRDRRRPVLSLDHARHAIFDAVTEPGPNGTVTNHYDAVDTLNSYAYLVRSLCPNEDEIQVKVVEEPDNRDYGWPDDGRSADNIWEPVSKMMSDASNKPASFRNLWRAGLDSLYNHYGVK